MLCETLIRHQRNKQILTYVNNKICEGLQAVRLIWVFLELLSVPDQEQSDVLLLSGHLQTEVHLFHLLWTVEQRRQHGHGFGRVLFGVSPHSLHLFNVAIRW